MSEQELPFPEAKLPRQKTDEELRQLCIDVYGGKVFTDRDCKRPEDIGMVFMVIGLAGIEAETEPALIYEYFDKAGPRSVNGMPIFMSCNVMNQADFNVWLPMFLKYAEQQQEFLNGTG